MAREWLSDNGLLKITAWARDGLTDEQIAHNMGIAYSTLRAWRDDYSAISTALKKGKEVVDIEVENALFKRAIGYHYEEEKIYQDNFDGENKERREIYRKYQAPDTTAQIFWLKNRKPDTWRNKIPQDDMSDTKTITITSSIPNSVGNEDE